MFAGFAQLRGVIGKNTWRTIRESESVDWPHLQNTGCEDDYNQITKRWRSSQKMLPCSRQRSHCGGSGVRLSGSVRKRESHGRALIDLTLHDSCAAVQIHDGFHQGQAQARALRAA